MVCKDSYEIIWIQKKNVSGIEEFEEKIDNWINDTGLYFWGFPLINQFYGEKADYQNTIVEDQEKEKTTKKMLEVTSFPK